MAKKIVVAEDDEDILFILDVILNDAGYHVVPMKDGSAIVEGTQDWPDLFIIDKDLPVIDGIAVSKYLRVHEQTKDIPIIMISAYHKLKHKAKDVGVNDFLEKPFDVRQLLRTVNKYIDQRR